MKKAIKKWTVALVAVMLLACLAFAATACGPDDTDDDPPATTYTVTFDQNYPNAPAATTATVEQGKKVAEPSEPTRTGHVFTGWYTSADLSTEYDFDSAVTGNLTLYAGWEQHFTVTFVLNYDGAPAATTEDVASGDTVAAPTEPGRTDYIFTGWYTDAACKNAYSFTTAVTSDLTLYAGWIEDSADVVTVTFNYNYDGATNETSYVAVGGTVTERAVEDRKTAISSDNGKYSYTFKTVEFDDWYTDSACTTKFDFSTPVNEDLTLYAGWETPVYDFEAELTSLVGKSGTGYSYGRNDEELIRLDTESRNQGAHMDASVGYLYNPGLTVDYVIYSDRAVDNVTLSARLSAEFRNIYIAPEQTTVGGTIYQSFQFRVNNVSVDYDPIALEGAKDQAVPDQRPFDDWEINDTVSLVEGANTITLVVNNADQFESTIAARAPRIDCIQLSTDAELSWEPVWANMDKATVDEA